MRYSLFVPIPGTALAERVIQGGAVVACTSAPSGDVSYSFEPATREYPPDDSSSYADRVMITVESVTDGASISAIAPRGDAMKVGEYDDWAGIVHVVPNFAAHAALRRWIGADESDDAFPANLRTSDLVRKVRRVLEIADESLRAELLETLRVTNHLDWLNPRSIALERHRRRRGLA